MKETDKFILYHGSKNGIKGEIQPSSRKHCDFGTGFYMGTEPEQPLTLICNFPKACLGIGSQRSEDSGYPGQHGLGPSDCL